MVNAYVWTTAKQDYLILCLTYTSISFSEIPFNIYALFLTDGRYLLMNGCSRAVPSHYGVCYD